MWIALPQFLLAPMVSTLLRFVEPRLPLALGFALVAAACFMAGQLTQTGSVPTSCHRRSSRRWGSHRY